MKSKTRGAAGKASIAPLVRRPPVVLMTMTAAKSTDCAAIKAMLNAGAEIVVVADDALEGALRIAEKVRRETANNDSEARR